MKGKTKPKSNGRASEASHGANGSGGTADTVLVPPEKRCKYRTEKGTPCRAARRKDGEYCIFHDRDFQRHRNEIKGARTMLDRREKPESAEGIHALLVRNVEELREGKIEPRVANSIAYHAQLLMANLDDLKRERARLIPASVEERLTELIVDKVLDDCEKEIRKVGENAYPGVVARRVAEQAKQRAAQGAAGATTPQIPAPRVREVAPGVHEVIGPRGMPVSLGAVEPEKD